MRIMTKAEAETQFPAIANNPPDYPIFVTEAGTTKWVILSATEYQRLKSLDDPARNDQEQPA